MVGRVKALVVGFVLGVFLAPRSGRESRRLLREKIEEFLALRDEGLERFEAEVSGRRGGFPGEEAAEADAPPDEAPDEPPYGAPEETPG